MLLASGPGLLWLDTFLELDISFYHYFKRPIYCKGKIMKRKKREKRGRCTANQFLQLLAYSPNCLEHQLSALSMWQDETGWTIAPWLHRSISRDLDQSWSSQDSNQGSYGMSNSHQYLYTFYPCIYCKRTISGIFLCICIYVSHVCVLGKRKTPCRFPV